MEVPMLGEDSGYVAKTTDFCLFIYIYVYFKIINILKIIFCIFVIFVVVGITFGWKFGYFGLSTEMCQIITQTEYPIFQNSNNSGPCQKLWNF